MPIHFVNVLYTSQDEIKLWPRWKVREFILWAPLILLNFMDIHHRYFRTGLKHWKMAKLWLLHTFMWSFIWIQYDIFSTIEEICSHCYMYIYWHILAENVLTGTTWGRWVRTNNRCRGGIICVCQWKMMCLWSHLHSDIYERPPPYTTTRVKSQSTNTLWRLITALRPSCCIWKGTMQSFLKSITQILLDIFIWLCSKKEMLFDFCLQSCTLLLNAATVSCKRAKAALTTLKCGWLPLVCFKTLGLTKTWFKCSVVISILVLGAQEYWASKGNLPHSKNEYT